MVESQVVQDELGTHLDWEHDGVTPRMIDWFWSNWGAFLPQLYGLYRVVESSAFNPYADRSVERVDGGVRYRWAA